MSGRGLTAEAEALVADYHGRMHEDGCECDAAFIRDPLRRIEAAAAREALPSVEEMAAALGYEGMLPVDGQEHYVMLADVIELWQDSRATPREAAGYLLAALRAARASDGGR